MGMESPSWQKTAMGRDPESEKNLYVEGTEARRKKWIESTANEFGMSVEDLNSLKRSMDTSFARTLRSKNPTGSVPTTETETIAGQVNGKDLSITRTIRKNSLDKVVRDEAEAKWGPNTFNGEDAVKMRDHVFNAMQERDKVNDNAKERAIEDITSVDDWRNDLLDGFFGKKKDEAQGEDLQQAA